MKEKRYKKAPVLLLVALGCIYLSEKMNGIGFKPYLDKLEQHLQELDKEK